MNDNFSGAWLQQLLRVITEAHQHLGSGGTHEPGFRRMLDGLLALTGSACGFIAEVRSTEEGDNRVSLKAVAPDEANAAHLSTEALALHISQPHTLPGQSLATGQPLYVNDASRCAELSEVLAGVESVQSLLCLPLHAAGDLQGIVGLANREGGYGQNVVEALEPVVSTAGYLIASVREQTGRLMAEVEATRGELLRRSVIETALDCVIAIDHEGKIIEFNPAAQKTFGWSRAEAIGVDLAEVVIPERLRELHRKGMGHYLATGEGPVIGNRIEVPAIRRDGTEFPVELAITVAELQEKPIFTAYLRDITERTRVEAELRQAREAAEAGSKARSAFVATVSHEIRTPINAIMGALGLLDSTDISASDRRYLKTAQRSADALLGLVDDVLDLSRIDAGRLEFENVETDPVELCDGVLQLFTHKAAAKGNQLGSVVQAGVPGTVMIDSGKVRQVLINLVGNAIKFTSNGRVRVDVVRDEQQLQFTVTDNGIGIAEQDIPELFTEFAQFGNAREQGGAGLGLAISKRLVEQMGGSVKVVSTIGEGSRFWFTVPFTSEGPAEPLRQQSIRALLVGADPFLTSLIGDQCTALGCKWKLAQTAELAAELLERGDHFDFMLLALETPPPDSVLQTMLALSATARESGIPLVIVAPANKECVDCLEQKLKAQVAITVPVLQGELASRVLGMITAGDDGGAQGPAHQGLTVRKLDRRIRVLLADDSQANRLVMGEMLRRSGFEADVVADGDEAVEAVRTLPYDLVLMDIEMPETDGMEATRRIRELGGDRAEIPVVALTANVLPDSRQRFVAAGMNDYVSKPVNRKTLVDTVMHWANREAAVTATLEGGDLAPSALDESALIALGIDTSPELVPKMIEVFIDELRLRARRIEQGAASGNIEKIAREAHALKSSAATYGAVLVAEQARRIDLACSENNGADAIAGSQRLLSVVEPTILALQRFDSTRL